jgi:Thiamine pyrophosphate enzyme, central domain
LRSDTGRDGTRAHPASDRAATLGVRGRARDDCTVGEAEVPALRGRVVVLAGPEVLDAGAVTALREFAAAGDLGVANTWGAKGVFAWDSPHHLGTCGLQAADFELLGFADADAIVCVGLDDDESPRARVALAPTVDVAPDALAAATGRVERVGAPLPNELYPRLAAVAQPGYVDDKVPLHPARAVADLGAVLPDGGFLAADPGVAGLWVARTFPTPALTPGAPRRVVVPARREPAAAFIRALAAARTGRPAIAVTTAPLDQATASAFDAVAAERLPLVIEVWTARGHLAHADDHRAQLAAALTAGTPRVLDVPVCLDDTGLLLAAAGDVVAWGGLEPASAPTHGSSGRTATEERE